MGMTKLVAHMIPGLLLIVVFAFLKSFVIPVEITVQGWFVFLTAAVFISFCTDNKAIIPSTAPAAFSEKVKGLRTG